MNPTPSASIASLTTSADGILEITLSRAGAVMLGLEVGPYPEKYKPIVLTGEQAQHAAYYIAEYLRNGVSRELFHDATGIEARESELVNGPLGRVVKLS